MEKLLFTSESVTEGHPDKMCDQISDAILDALLEKDPMSRVACETAVTTGLVLVMGEITTNAYVDIQKTVRETIREIGYDRAKYGFDCDTCGVIVAIDEQSADIALGHLKRKVTIQIGDDTVGCPFLDDVGADDRETCLIQDHTFHYFALLSRVDRQSLITTYTHDMSVSGSRERREGTCGQKKS